MGAKRSRSSLPSTLPFETFWKYLEAHPNCIVRAGTPEAALYDDEDLHWHFATGQDGTVLVELIRGKKLVGDLVIAPSDVSYVQVEPEPDARDEWRFDLISETKDDRVSTHFFVMTHGYEGGDDPPPNRWTH